MVSLKLAPQGVYRTVQGEGVLLGASSIFVRLAGCSVGCKGCDTDYREVWDVDLHELSQLISACRLGNEEWLWVTGGEPTDWPQHVDLPRIGRELGLKVGLATAGTRSVVLGGVRGGYDFVSVSPHRLEGWVQRRGDQVNLVPGLGGLDLTQWRDVDFSGFVHKWVTPMAPVTREGVEGCLRWIDGRKGWRLGVQAHKHWRLP